MRITKGIATVLGNGLFRFNYKLISWFPQFSHPSPVPSSKEFWEEVYASGGNSGPGSYGELANYKAFFVNDLVQRFQISSVIDLGCGDGNQLSLLKIDNYCGIDVSETAISYLKTKYKEDQGKSFFLFDEYNGSKVDLVLSQDVIYHLIEDEVFESYMTKLFEWSNRYVVIYSSNFESRSWGGHVRHRKFSVWIETNCPEFKMIHHDRNPHFSHKGNLETFTTAEFYVYERNAKSLDKNSQSSRR